MAQYDVVQGHTTSRQRPQYVLTYEPEIKRSEFKFRVRIMDYPLKIQLLEKIYTIIQTTAIQPRILLSTSIQKPPTKFKAGRLSLLASQPPSLVVLYYRRSSSIAQVPDTRRCPLPHSWVV